jgi:hypothetical protein
MSELSRGIFLDLRDDSNQVTNLLTENLSAFS